MKAGHLLSGDARHHRRSRRPRRAEPLVQVRGGAAGRAGMRQAGADPRREQGSHGYRPTDKRIAELRRRVGVCRREHGRRHARGDNEREVTSPQVLHGSAASVPDHHYCGCDRRIVRQGLVGRPRQCRRHREQHSRFAVPVAGRHRRRSPDACLRRRPDARLLTSCCGRSTETWRCSRFCSTSFRPACSSPTS